jgi:putative ABC transport system permease protein
MILQNILMALESIRHAKLRSFLTMLGIIIGVSSVVTVIALGAGVKASIADQVSGFGANLIQVTPGRAFGGEEGEASSFNFTAALGSSTLTEQDVEIIQEAPNVKTVAPFMFLSGVPRTGEKTASSALIAATTPPMVDILNKELSTGNFLSEDTSNEAVAVLGSGVAEKLFGNTDPIGKTIEIRNTDFRIIGVMKAEDEEGFSFSSQFNNMMYIPLSVAKKLNGGTVNIMEIDIQAESAENIDQVVTDIKIRLKEAHGGEEDFTVLTSEDQLELFDEILNIMTSFVAAIAGISLLVGGIGVMNIMFVSVTERTREIGIRKAIGATSGSIMVQFLIEAIVISLIGGLLGVGFAMLMGLGIKTAAGLTPVFTLNAFIIAVSISTIVGIIFGTAPAVKAARKNPIEALRYE